MEHHTTIKKNQLLLHATTQINLIDIIIREKKLDTKDYKWYVHLYDVLTLAKVFYSDRHQKSDCLG